MQAMSSDPDSRPPSSLAPVTSTYPHTLYPLSPTPTSTLPTLSTSPTLAPTPSLLAGGPYAPLPSHRQPRSLLHRFFLFFLPASVAARRPNAPPPWGLRWRSSTAFVTLVVAVAVGTDMLIYGLIVPIMPFRLTALHYHHPSSLTGYLLAAYAVGLIASTPPVALLSERLSSRQIPLLITLLFMAASLVLFMFAKDFALLAIARICQGVSGTGIWTLGLALIGDTVEEEKTGQIMGFVMAGYSVGLLLGPPVGGVMYDRLGFRKVFVFALCVVALDAILRLLVIEKRHAVRWLGNGERREAMAQVKANGQGKGAGKTKAMERRREEQEEGVDIGQFSGTKGDASRMAAMEAVHQGQRKVDRGFGDEETLRRRSSVAGSDAYPPPALFAPARPPSPPPRPPPLSAHLAVLALMQSPRALSAFLIVTSWGFVVGTQDPTVPLYLHDRYHLSPLVVGLVYFVQVGPTFVTGPLSGWMADRWGVKKVTLIGILCLTPWMFFLAISGPLAFWIVCFGMEGGIATFMISPIMKELTDVARSIPGIGYAPVYGAFNLCFSIATLVGPIVGGQIYTHVRHPNNWLALCMIWGSIATLCIPIAWFFLGDKSKQPNLFFWRRADARARARSAEDGDDEGAAEAPLRL